MFIGLQFFISATAWYCKLCDIWIGDLHCASLHLKSKNHAHNYSVSISITYKFRIYFDIK